MGFQIMHKAEIVRSARQAFEEGKTINDCPGHMVPWLKQWQFAFLQIKEEAQAKESA